MACGILQWEKSRPSRDSLVLADVVSLTLDWNLPELSDNVSWTSSLR